MSNLTRIRMVLMDITIIMLATVLLEEYQIQMKLILVFTVAAMVCDVFGLTLNTYVETPKSN